ncbi:MAG: hypothetical protein ABII88_03705 [Candidatus Omnitrophota bacterium]
MQNSQISQLGLVKKSWASGLAIIMTNHNIIIPFGIIAILELAGIFGIFIFEQPPLLVYLKPIVLRFWGEKFLHYPLNLILVSKLFYYFQSIIAVILGPFMSGMTVLAVYRYSRTKVMSLKGLFGKTFLKYINLLIIGLMVYFVLQLGVRLEGKVLLKIMQKGPDFLGIARDDWSLIFIFLNVIMAGLIHSLFIFAQPAVMISGKNFLTAIISNFVHVFKNSFAAAIIVVFPLFLYIPIALLKGRLFALMEGTVPEVVFVVLIAGVFISLFVNVFVTISATKLYLLVEGKDDGKYI